MKQVADHNTRLFIEPKGTGYYLRLIINQAQPQHHFMQEICHLRAVYENFVIL